MDNIAVGGKDVAVHRRIERREAFKSSPVNSASGVVKHQPVVERTFWLSVMGIFTTSSIGYGNDQCKPAVNSAFWPVPTGLPKRRITAFSAGPTWKKPDAKNATTSSTSTTLTIAKLLRNASASACEPASCVSGA